MLKVLAIVLLFGSVFALPLDSHSNKRPELSYSDFGEDSFSDDDRLTTWQEEAAQVDPLFDVPITSQEEKDADRLMWQEKAALLSSNIPFEEEPQVPEQPPSNGLPVSSDRLSYIAAGFSIGLIFAFLVWVAYHVIWHVMHGDGRTYVRIGQEEHPIPGSGAVSSAVNKIKENMPSIGKGSSAERPAGKPVVIRVPGTGPSK